MPDETAPLSRDSAVAAPELLDVAVAAARLAGAELLERFASDPVDVQTKSTDTDPVSAADLAAERAIRGLLARERPGDAILGEEGGLTLAADGARATGLRWVVDPLDGTVNYLYGIPHFAVSVAVEDGDGRGLAGAVLNPVSGELYTATRSGPPLLDGRPIAPRTVQSLGHALVATGFGYDAAVRAQQGQIIAALLPRVRDIRRPGAAALDLCAAAAGRVDAYFERGVKPWDVAAGSLLCERAGLVVRELDPVAAGASGDGGVALPGGILVAPPAIAEALYALVVGSSR